MQGCFAPSEVPGISSSEASVFGHIAEVLIYADFCKTYTCVSPQVFFDDNNPAGYLAFLVFNNPQFTEALQHDFYARLLGEKLMRIPDIAVHQPTEKAFYEIKPRSVSGIRDGTEKVGVLSAVYPFYHLPYTPGIVFLPQNHRLAFLGNRLTVELKVERIAPGLIVYQLCVRTEELIELATLAVLLRHIIRQLNQQKDTNKIDGIDLEPIFARNQQLEQVGRALGLTMATAAAATVAIGWRHFWKAVIRRFAVRGAVAAALSAADGPLPVGEMIAAGMAIWTIIDVVRLSDELWQDAAVIAKGT